MNVGVIGFGVMGKNHARVYSKLRDVDCVYVYDVNPSVYEDHCYHADSCFVFVDALDDLIKHVDCVSITTSTSHHHTVALRTIRAGIPTLIEKPVTEHVIDAVSLRDATQNGVVVGVAHIERFNPVVHEIERIIDKPIFIEFKRHNPLSSRISDTTVVEDLMIHDIDILMNVFKLDGFPSFTSSGFTDVCCAMADFDCTVVSLSSSRKACKKIRTIYVEEDEFTIVGNLMSQEVYVYEKGSSLFNGEHRFVQENMVSKVLLNKVEPLEEELRSFIKSANDGTPFEVTLDQGINNLRLCVDIRKDLRDRRKWNEAEVCSYR